MKNTFSVAALSCAIALLQGCSSGPKQFNSPEEASRALVAAAYLNSADQLNEVLGSGAADLISSGDEVEDRNRLREFATRYDQKHSFTREADGSMTLVVGANQWPMPIPLVKDEKSGMWSFDVAQGKEEIINRRIGRNELSAIQVCLAIADAQREYSTMDADKDGVAQYAQKILSDPGKKNGLFWKVTEGETPSPLGELAATAAEEGYTRPEAGAPRPYHGYYYRVLTAQGANAKGGARSYLIDGKMIGGFALVAHPAQYGNSGIMTFIVNHEGVVYESDLGENTANAAKQMTEFDPSPQWQKVDMGR